MRWRIRGGLAFFLSMTIIEEVHLVIVLRRHAPLLLVSTLRVDNDEAGTVFPIHFRNSKRSEKVLGVDRLYENVRF
ncbi:hypothetical protein MUK42_09010 [Musa troglodytarum]|uniref:Uncharacterized protein n=1 Tax=Musa troglodytarum TaxID=320322 RepID=A0A9E7FK48_9LILI|nr:hypothetical protein MUK42_09010 [Musa troglodytarum]